MHGARSGEARQRGGMLLVNSGRPARILLAIDGLGPGGAERQFCLLAGGLRESAALSVMAFRGGAMAAGLEGIGIEPLIAGKAGTVRSVALRRAVSHLRDFKPDIVHSWGWMSAFFLEAATRLGLCTVHVSGLVRMGTLPRRKRVRLVLAARLGSLSIGNSDAGLRAWGIPARRARLVANGFDPERLSGLVREERGERPFTVVMAGSMSDHKDFASLVRAAAILREKAPGRFLFNLLGDGEDRAALLKLSQELDCDDSVAFPGRTGSILPWLVRSDAGVLVSPMGEGMSNFLMECMAAGIPVVCTAGGGNAELVRDSVDGFMLRGPDPAVIAERLLFLEGSPGVCAEMGRSGRDRILKGFSAERMVGETVRVYTEALHMKGVTLGDEKKT